MQAVGEAQQLHGHGRVQQEMLPQQQKQRSKSGKDEHWRQTWDSHNAGLGCKWPQSPYPKQPHKVPPKKVEVHEWKQLGGSQMAETPAQKGGDGSIRDFYHGTYAACAAQILEKGLNPGLGAGSDQLKDH